MGKRKLVEKKESISKACQSFINYKIAQGLSERTVKDYQSHINLYIKRFGDVWDNLENNIILHMSDKIKPATYNLRFIYLRAFFTWCVMQRHINTNPLDGFKRRKANSRIVDIPLDTLQALLCLPDKTTFAGFRDYCLILFILDTGARPGEALQLFKKHFDFSYNNVTIPCEIAKTRTQRVLPMLPTTTGVIVNLVSYHTWDNAPVFCSNEGTKLNVSSWDKRIKGYGDKLKIDLHPYDLRHAFALMYLRNGGNAFSLQQTMGHTDLNMTKRYLNITGQDLKDAHKQASPLNSLIKQSHKRLGKLP